MVKIGMYLCALALTCGASVAQSGLITYVDASANTTGSNGNTTINGSLVSAGNTGTSSTDGFWNNRALAGTNGTGVWETDNSSTAAESTQPLITTIVLPGAGTY